MLRRIAETLTRRMVFRRAMPAAFGSAPIYVSPGASLAYLLKPMAAIDPPLLRAATLVQPGHVVWDIGANVGLFAVAAAVRAGSSGQVHCFEPDAWLARLLERTGRALPDTAAPLVVGELAVAGSDGPRAFGIARRSRASNALVGFGSTQSGGFAQVVEVQAATLDTLLETRAPPDVLKIDTEGAEHEVLRPGSKMLAVHRPIVICEVSRGSALGRVFDEAAYVMFDGERDLRTPIRQPAHQTIAIPAESLPR